MTTATSTAAAPPAAAREAPTRNRSIEGLRAVGALLVLLTHVSINATGNRGWWGAFLARMDVGVTIFFVISGFLLYRPFARALLRGTDRPDTRRYVRHRLTRIVPLYWVVIVVSFLFAPAYGGLGEPATTSVPLWRMFRFATFTQVYWRDSLSDPIPQAWSLAVEMAFYVLLPVLAWALARRAAGDRAGRLRRQWFALGGLVVVAQVFRAGMVLLTSAYEPGHADTAYTVFGAWLPNHLDVFALGMLLAVLSVELADRGPGLPLAQRVQDAMSRPGATAASWLVALGCFVLVAKGIGLSTTALTYGRGQEFLRHWLYAGVAFFLVLPAVFGPPLAGLGRRFLSGPVMQFLGRISYGIFLWQVLVIGRWVSSPFVRPFAAARHPGAQFHLSIWSTLVWTLVVTLVLSTISWYLVERPALRFKDRKLSSFTAGLWLISLASFAMRLVVIGTINDRNPGAGLGRAPTPGEGGDPFYYHAQANLLAAGRGFAEPFGWIADHVLHPTALHPPLFTLWLTPASLVGAGGYLSHKVMASFAGLGIVVVAGLLGRRVAGPRAGLLAAGLVALYPNLWIIDGILWPEGLYTFIVGLALLAVYRWLDRPAWVWSAAVGAAIGLAALARGEALLLLPLLALPMAFGGRDALDLDVATRVKHLVVVGLVAGAVLVPWTVRNLLHFSEPVALSTNSEEVLYYANCPDVYSGPLIGSWSFNCQVRARARGEEPKGDEVEKAKVWRQRGIDYALAHKDRWPAVALARVSRVWDLKYGENNVVLLRFEGRPERWNRIGLWTYRVLLVPAAAGIWLLRRRRQRMWPILVLFAMVTATALYAYGAVRFRTPGDLTILVLAAVALDAVLPRRGTPDPEPVPEGAP